MFNIEVDHRHLDDIRKRLRLTEKQYRASLKRAVKRTAGTARAAIGKSKLGISDLRRTTTLRKRVRPLFSEVGDMKTGIWIGLNDLWASEFAAGRPKRTPTGVDFRGQHFQGAFLVRHAGAKRSRIYRNENGKLVEMTIPIAEQAADYLDRHIVPDLPAQLLHHFQSDSEFRKQIGASLSGKGARRKFYRT
ncbi:hypothetical protein F4212_01420 [Candidatus Poribacteria bacterium]|nr:hypothetical protein [Candidatus Poribacteria bacterium]